MNPWYRQLDWTTLVLWLALVGTGLLAIYSSTNGPASEFLLASVRESFSRQAMWAVISLVGVGVALVLPVRFYQKSAYWIYGALLVLLVATLLFGREINGTTAWLVVGPVRLQVSELAKVGTLLAVARMLSSQRPQTSQLRSALYAVGLILLPTILISMQNDTGTTLVFLAMIPVMLFWSGLPIAIITLLISPALAGYLAIVYLPAALVYVALVVGAFLWWTRDRLLTTLAGFFNGGVVLALTVALTYIFKPYQVARVLSFTDPGAEEYRMGVGFHLVQSKAAIGSGGLTGKGYMEGTQTQGAYVPEQSTDFIFSVIGEEFGFIGGILLLGLFALLLTRLVLLGTRVKHPFGTLFAAGVTGVFLVHVFINIGMATAILPVIGLPLPFVSYGGSALLAHTGMLAIVLALHMRRDDFSIYAY